MHDCAEKITDAEDAVACYFILVILSVAFGWVVVICNGFALLRAVVLMRVLVVLPLMIPYWTQAERMPDSFISPGH